MVKVSGEYYVVWYLWLGGKEKLKKFDWPYYLLHLQFFP